MNIKFINDTLADRLGFATTSEMIGRCWLDFIPEKNQENIKSVHYAILHGDSNDYNEFLNKLVSLDGSEFQVQWFNTLLNHDTNWSFSFGMPKENSSITTMEKVREDFRSRIESDKTMIRSLKTHVNNPPEEHDLIITCETELETENTF
jgi:PAS domain S-box-containing protein